ncbi:hypothetical protein L0F63_004868 [Massospora cicadina]|nr:hypothetical protein L0F63_004868 [Massospora cicadina]
MEMKFSLLQLFVATTLCCTSKFFCDGPVLHKIQTSPHIVDGKYFVDMASARPEADILAEFNQLPAIIDEEDLARFLNKNFHVPGYELEAVEIKDYPALPDFLKRIKDERMRAFGKFIHTLWGTLVRRFDKGKLCEGCESSLVDLDYPFVIPGGRFREFYYWDSFFVLEGLNLSNLEFMSKNMLLNLLDLVAQVGHIPNAARKYMLNRSQPPFLTITFDRYLQRTKDLKFLDSAIALLDKEYQYWRSKHDVQLVEDEKLFLTRYVVNCSTPRPESYREDRTTAGVATGANPDASRALYAEIAAGAESGYDYSSRWIPDASLRLEDGPTTQEALLRGLRTSSILPVDLNSLMYLNERTLARFHRQLASDRSVSKCNCPKRSNHLAKAKAYDLAADQRAQLMYDYMWDERNKAFYDYDLNSGRRIRRFSASGIWPFWADALTPKFRNHPSNYLLAFEAFNKARHAYNGSTPATVTNSSLQWDYPNAWAPLEYVSVEALLKTQTSLASRGIDATHLKRQALDIATRFFQSAFCAWYSSGGSTETLPRLDVSGDHLGYLFEKYSVEQIGKVGGGGEYEVQLGFGWTNGVLLHFMDRFGNQLTLPQDLSTCVTKISIPHPKESFGRTTPYSD